MDKTVYIFRVRGDDPAMPVEHNSGHFYPELTPAPAYLEARLEENWKHRSRLSSHVDIDMARIIAARLPFRLENGGKVRKI